MSRTRKQEVGLDELDAVIDRMQQRVLTLRTVRKSMASQEKEGLLVDGTVMLDRSFGYIDTFIHSCKRELGMP